jgi:hypothetical protein
MRTPRLNTPLAPPQYWASLPPSRRCRLLVLLGAMVLEALHASPHAAEVDDERRRR